MKTIFSFNKIRWYAIIRVVVCMYSVRYKVKFLLGTFEQKHDYASYKNWFFCGSAKGFEWFWD